MQVLLLSSFLLAGLSQALWPEPEQYTHGNEVVWLSPDVHFAYHPRGSSGNATVSKRLQYVVRSELQRNSSHSPAAPVEDIVKKAIQRTTKQLQTMKFVPWKFHPRNRAFEPSPQASKRIIREVVISEQSLGGNRSHVRDFIHGDESYQIKITGDGSASISTKSPIGTLRALQTFAQLFYAHSSGSGKYSPYAPIAISDKPKWPHRGLNLDIARNPITPGDVKRTIDAMESAKLNRLHIHATDTQSWPLEIPSVPALAAKGAYHSSLIWSAKDLQEVQQYATERGVSAFLEIDMPGHTGSIGYAFPELVVASGENLWEKYAQQPPSGQIKLNSSAARELVDKVMDDILPRVSPFTKYFHIGGDEFNLESYMLEKSISSSQRTVLKPLVQSLITRVCEKLAKAGLIPIVWEELVVDWDLSFPPQSSESGNNTVIVQAWRNSRAIRRVLDRGYRTLFGTSDFWYLDCGVGIYLNPRNGSEIIRPPYTDWCSPTKNWRHMYMHDPLLGIQEKLQPLIEGGETHMWSENVDPVNMDQLIWPRAAAAAEVLWKGPRTRFDIKGASFRLGEWRERAVVDRKIGAGLVQMTYCLMQEGSCER
ncbi:Glucosamine-6-phosphate isomerase (Glucosamine-6-phosphate deaminase) (GNPDA) (GlcN6P deaminase) [Ophidiomyces ophidiicola]|uniref:Glucosamine-6-phosphate isomerase (Glucosamine-6-phosphate deaminase) (GNPDA) (GlcN6P deaminase) n=1 Tax=Ophidiomyces ophidiicola TaxID=1387563 RepID=A0ACB8UQW0_9EURO|nr:Glucosamine-6-phosphate isomerase (Glucosamine-6-phosphate deaminase) (GNPDA) (GlcN6P deaminase) [Ophidiomyces ophidiicola]KAI1921551.1 Glucosamine-6-phosphate isomerase (Glucosamine-6-phosphate deaminase) (GNPDA) (GlcN6P deaminase) [Ophidiomyces ophidiicola]KAI1944406.1 Glucosamine-6-phosphate isomerase (Glucosamine-6-phosphate deaminase) (GNPDA) (GlcN6P deaminase) [Ophidiomyces ophidiicola]KAI1948997.1 Glucosamine-6-phosphate isomerase (Glucosamine-6-phosphate deaminase) (GNPDA) (GlcN6P dea